MKTNADLVTLAKKALAENWGYCLGEFGRVLTESLYTYNTGRQDAAGAYNRANAAYLKQFVGKRVSDCYGLVKACCWTDLAGVVAYNGNGCADRNQEAAYNAAKEKGALSTIPEIPGLVLWMPGHAGVYIGGGEFIECAGAPVGVRKGKIQNGAVTSGSKFTHWFKDTYIQYSFSDALTFDAACDRLEKAGIMNPAAYWQARRGIDPYFEGLVVNMAGRV